MRLNHIDLQVSDVDRARDFFETHFGFRCAYRRKSEIALMEDEAGLSLGVSNLFGSPPPTYPPDFHIGFKLGAEAEVRAKYEQLKAAGVPIEHGPTVGGAAVYFVCLAPDGIPVEVSARTGG